VPPWPGRPSSIPSASSRLATASGYLVACGVLEVCLACERQRCTRADQLLARAQAEGIKLLGPDGLLSQVTKAVLERALAEEMGTVEGSS
jgi:hypothetical protein